MVLTRLQVFLCETPGIWGSLPKGYDHLWLGHIEAYITYNVAERSNFVFKKGICNCENLPSFQTECVNIHTSVFFFLDAATKLEITYDKANELCVMVSSLFHSTFLCFMFTIVYSSCVLLFLLRILGQADRGGAAFVAEGQPRADFAGHFCHESDCGVGHYCLD